MPSRSRRCSKISKISKKSKICKNGHNASATPCRPFLCSTAHSSQAHDTHRLALSACRLQYLRATVPMCKRWSSGTAHMLRAVRWSSCPYTMTHPDTMPCAFHVLRSRLRAGASMTTEAVPSISCANAMTTAHTRNGWPSIQTECNGESLLFFVLRLTC